MATAEVATNAGFTPIVTEEQIQVIEKERSGLLQRATSLVIATVADYETACGIVKGIADLRKMIADDFKDSKEAAHKAHKAICDQEKKHLEELAEPDRIVRLKIGNYNAEQEKARRATEEAARVQAQKDAEEKRLQEAIKVESAGGTKEKVDAVLAAPIMAAPVVVPRAEVPKVSGVAMVDDWKFEIVDAALIPREYLMVNESAIGKVVKALKSGANIAGVRVYNEPKTRVTAGR